MLRKMRTEIERLRARRSERRLYERLLDMDDHLLRDMGVLRQDLEALVGRPPRLV